ncbi:MAG: TetR family transcriptional regulator, partial [Proteobacteria bacterium]|nr:TetR family transcriptional regulator [Pseudomonadota bacterium]
RQPRAALEDGNGPAAMVEAAMSMLALCKPYARGSGRTHLDSLMQRYNRPAD